MHSIGFIHGDLKLDNIIIGRDNPSLIYLIDFGIAESFMDGNEHINKKKTLPWNKTSLYHCVYCIGLCKHKATRKMTTDNQLGEGKKYWYYCDSWPTCYDYSVQDKIISVSLGYHVTSEKESFKTTVWIFSILYLGIPGYLSIRDCSGKVCS